MAENVPAYFSIISSKFSPENKCIVSMSPRSIAPNLIKAALAAVAAASSYSNKYYGIPLLSSFIRSGYIYGKSQKNTI